MKILDLCSGLGGASQAFKDRGHEVVTVDTDRKFNPSIAADVRFLNFKRNSFDVVLAGPPCIVFSIAGVWKYWKYIDSHLKEKEEALSVVKACFRIIKEIEPQFYVVENPQGMLRKFIGLPTETIFQCSYGKPFKKPTDLWHNLSKNLKKPCAPHQSNPRGLLNTLRDPAKRSKWPYQLSLEICLIAEGEIR